MDPFDHLAGPAANLLGRVDDLLVHDGAPEDHRIWLLLRRLGVLPGEAVEALVALRPAPLAAAGTDVREVVREYDDVCSAIGPGGGWEGAGAQAFAAQRAALMAHLSGDPESLGGRLDATASYLAAVADWTTWCRAALARTLAGVLGSAEAVAVVAQGGPGGGATCGAVAAAEIGARVLATVAEAYDRGEILVRRWAPGLAEVAFRPPVDAGTRLDATTRLTF